ncbi:MAG: ABC transporter substrate-binding protein [Elusimicrobiota bacterium]
MEAIKLILVIFFFVNFSSAEIYVDALGNKIELNKKPQRIIALGPGAARLVSYLGKIDMLVGVENIEIKYPQGRAYSLAYKDKFSKLPIVSEGGPDKLPDYEKIIALNPDIIITCSLDREVARTINYKTKIPVFMTDYGNLGTFDVDKFKRNIKTLAFVLGAEKEVNSLIEKINFYSSDLKKRSIGVKNPGIYVGGLGFKGAHGIVSTQYAYEPFSLLGLKSVIDTQEILPAHIFIDKEKLLSLNPDYIFIDLGGLDIFIEDYTRNKEYYSILSAFKKKNVYTLMAYNYYTTNVEVVFINAYFIGKTLFPEKFKDIDMDKKARSIIKDFIKKDVYDELNRGKRGYKRINFENGIRFE